MSPPKEALSSLRLNATTLRPSVDEHADPAQGDAASQEQNGGNSVHRTRRCVLKQGKSEEGGKEERQVLAG